MALIISTRVAIPLCRIYYLGKTVQIWKNVLDIHHEMQAYSDLGKVHVYHLAIGAGKDALNC